MSTRVDVWRLLGVGGVAAPEPCGCRPGPRVFVCVLLALHGAFDVVEDARGAKWCARVRVVHVEVSSVGIFACSALRVRPGSDNDRLLGNRLAGALVYPVRVGDARLDRCGGFLGCVCAPLVLRPFLVESVYVLGGFNPVGDARQVEASTSCAAWRCGAIPPSSGSVHAGTRTGNYRGAGLCVCRREAT